MTTRDVIKYARKVAKENGDNKIAACLYVIEAYYIVGEINEVSDILVKLAKQKLKETEVSSEFPFEI